MAKVICPECGHRHTIGQEIKTVGVRAKRITGNQFEYSLTTPQSMESGHFTSRSDDLILSGALGLATGALFGLVGASIIPDYTIQCVAIGGNAGLVVGWGWLCAEYNQRLKRIVPWFAEQSARWETAKALSYDEGVTLTIDHQKRDNLSEPARTIQRFGQLPVDVARFNEWAQGALVGKSLAVAQWTPQAKGFTRPEYDQLLDQLRRGGVIVNAGSNKGNVLTTGGRRALSQHLRQCGITPPSPANEIDFLGERLAQAKAANGGNTPLPHRSDVRVGGENGV